MPFNSVEGTNMPTTETNEDIDDTIAQEVEEQERERRAIWWMDDEYITSRNGIVLLALVVVIQPLIDEPVPIRASLVTPQEFTPPEDREVVEPEVTVDIKVDTKVESTETDLTPLDESLVDFVSEDLSAVSENVTARAMAIGAGASGGSGGLGAFMPGGGTNGGGAFFGLGEGAGHQFEPHSLYN